MKSNKLAAILAALALVVFSVAIAVGADKVSQRKVSKATGGSTGDSMIVAADTSVAFNLGENLNAWWVVAACDSQASYATEISPDGTHWYQVDIDTVASGSLESSADLGKQYGGMRVRLILDNLTAAGAPFGNVWIVQQ